VCSIHAMNTLVVVWYAGKKTFFNTLFANSAQHDGTGTDWEQAVGKYTVLLKRSMTKCRLDQLGAAAALNPNGGHAPDSL